MAEEPAVSRMEVEAGSRRHAKEEMEVEEGR